MSATGSQGIQHSGHRLRASFSARLIRSATAWTPGAPPQDLPLQDLETADAIRWVDIYPDHLSGAELLALLNPICHAELTGRMIRDLAIPSRYPAGRLYSDRAVSITAAFRIRRSDRHDLFDPVHLLVGEDWLITCWLPPRRIRGGQVGLEASRSGSGDLYAGVAESWQRMEGGSAEDLANLVRRELAIACGYRPRLY